MGWQLQRKKGKNERMRISFTILIIMKSPCLPHKAFSSSALQMQCVRTTFNIQVCFHFTTKWLNSQGNPVSLEHETPTVKIHFHQNEKLQHGAQIFSKHCPTQSRCSALSKESTERQSAGGLKMKSNYLFWNDSLLCHWPQLSGRWKSRFRFFLKHPSLA